MTNNLLAFAPHPDDIEIFSGGFLLSAKDKGYSTIVIDMVRGELGSQGSIEERAKESAAASKILGLSGRENLALRDGYVGKEHPESSRIAQLNSVVDAIRRLKPEIVLAPYWQARHPDHYETSKLVTEACFYAALRKFDAGTSAAPHSVRQVLYYQMRYTFTPTFITDITPHFEKKYEAVAAYASQVNHRESENPGGQTLISSPLSVTSLKARDNYYGSMIGVQYGEPYLIKNTLRLDDPIGFFRQLPTQQPLLYPGEQ